MGHGGRWSAQVDLRYSRSGGPGGQNVNKADGLQIWSLVRVVPQHQDLCQLNSHFGLASLLVPACVGCVYIRDCRDRDLKLT